MATTTKHETNSFLGEKREGEEINWQVHMYPSAVQIELKLLRKWHKKLIIAVTIDIESMVI